MSALCLGSASFLCFGGITSRLWAQTEKTKLISENSKKEAELEGLCGLSVCSDVLSIALGSGPRKACLG